MVILPVADLCVQRNIVRSVFVHATKYAVDEFAFYGGLSGTVDRVLETRLGQLQPLAAVDALGVAADVDNATGGKISFPRPNVNTVPRSMGMGFSPPRRKAIGELMRSLGVLFQGSR